MLIISRKKDQKILVADEIEITILDVGRNKVRFGVKAPKHITIHTRLKGVEQEAVGAATKPSDSDPGLARL
jgi:carbon storage regulator